MILEVSFEDFRFFKGKNFLSFSADARTKKLLSNSTEIDGKRVLKSLGLYGPNNSGKTNILNLFKIIKKVLSGDIDFSCNRSFFGDSNVTNFEITYDNDDENGWLSYEFTYDSVSRRFVKEKLTSIKFYNAGSPFFDVKFEKDIENKRFLVFGEDCSNVLSLIPSKFPILYSLELDSGKFAPLAAFRDSLRKAGDSIEIVKMFNIPIEKTIQSLKSGDEERRHFILSFVKDADLSVNDFAYRKNIKPGENDKEIDEKALSGFEQLPDAYHLMTTYGSASVPSLFFDSNGTKKIEAIASYIYEALSQGKLLVVDELDNGLHFKLTRAIVSAFNNLANRKGQLLFSAHDLLLIDSKNLLRKEQIYFLERNAEKARLYCLKQATTAEGGPREGSDLLKRYNHGDFGCVPTPDFIDEVIDVRNQEAKKR
jgi:AAA15 family ATPase/GTPase